VDHTLRLIQYNWVVLAYNLNVVILVLITGELSIGAIYAYHFISVLSLLLPCIIILFLHLLSTNHKCTQPCYFPLLLRRRRWTGILRRGVLGYVLPRLPFLWSYGVFHYSIPLRVIIGFRDITDVVIILYPSETEDKTPETAHTLETAIFSHIEHISHQYPMKVKFSHKWQYFHTLSIFHTNIQ
jgi:hypothetical protein